LEDLSLGNPEQPCNVQVVPGLVNNFLKWMSSWQQPVATAAWIRHVEADSPESLLLGQTITDTR
jgi:hypothetical protein